MAEEENAKGLGRGSPPFQKQFLSVTSSTLRCSECTLGLSVSSTGNHILCSFPFLVHLNASRGMVSDAQDWISGSYIFLLQPQQFPLANIITQLLKSSSYFSIKYSLWKYSAILLFLEMVNFDWGLLYKIKHTFGYVCEKCGVGLWLWRNQLDVSVPLELVCGKGGKAFRIKKSQDAAVSRV